MRLNLNIDKTVLITDLAYTLDTVEFNNFILELIRVKYYSKSTYTEIDLENLINQITDRYTDVI